MSWPSRSGPDRYGAAFAALSWVLLLGLTGLARPARSAGDPHPVQRDLKHLGHDLERERRLYKKLLHESSSLLETMGHLDQQVEGAEREREETEKRLADLEVQLAESRAQQQQASKSLIRLKGRLGGRLRRLYMLGEVGWLNLVFGADSISEGLERYELLKRLALADQSLARRVALSRDLLAQTETRIRQQVRDLEQARKQVEQRRIRAAAMRDEQLHALELVEHKAKLRKRAVAELRQARSSLADLVRSLEGQVSAAKGFASWQGRLPAPVRGGRVEVGFGRQVDERFKTVTIHKGVDIRAPRKTPVRAVYPGKVVYTGVLRGYGRMVILDHGGGYYTLYAHLDRIDAVKEKRLRQGDEVGTLGESGSLKGPFLYFEVRRGGQAVDPAAWVRLGPS